MSHDGHSPASSLAMPLLATSPDREDAHFETDGDISTAWTPQDSPRHQLSIGSGNQPMYSPFSAYRESNLSEHMKHVNQRESRARCSLFSRRLLCFPFLSVQSGGGGLLPFCMA